MGKLTTLLAGLAVAGCGGEIHQAPTQNENGHVAQTNWPEPVEQRPEERTNHPNDRIPENKDTFKLPVEGEIFAEIDGLYDRNAIIKLIESRDPVTEFTPELRDFTNEFYAAHDMHDDLRNQKLGLVDSFPEDLSPRVGQHFYRSNTNEILNSLDFVTFFKVLVHEISHQFDGNEHKRIDAVDVATPLLMYTFDPLIGQHFLSSLGRQMPAVTGSYEAVFWTDVARTGTVQSGLHTMLYDSTESLERWSKVTLSAADARYAALEELRSTLPQENWNVYGADVGQRHRFYDMLLNVESYMRERAPDRILPHDFTAPYPVSITALNGAPNFCFSQYFVSRTIGMTFSQTADFLEWLELPGADCSEFSQKSFDPSYMRLIVTSITHYINDVAFNCVTTNPSNGFFDDFSIPARVRPQSIDGCLSQIDYAVDKTDAYLAGIGSPNGSLVKALEDLRAVQVAWHNYAELQHND